MAQALPGDPPGREPRALLDRLFFDRWEFWLVVALTSFAGVLRFWHLTVLPFGFHGDEANVTLDSERIANHGWIGSWSDLSLGYPIAVNYFVAPFVKVLGAGVLGVRLPVAILGTSAAPLTYLVVRNVAGWRAAICATLLLTVSLWHLHLSRMGIPVIGWPTMELAALLCLQMGIKSRNRFCFLGGGLLVGVGLWIYNSTFVFAFAVGVYLAGWFIVEAFRHRDRTILRNGLLLAVFGLSAFFAAKPILDYMRSPRSNYDGRFQQVYIFSDEKQKECAAVAPQQRDLLCQYAVTTSFSGRVEIVRHNLKTFYTRIVDTGFPDYIDGLGARPPLGRITAYLAMLGAVVAIFRYRTREAVIIGFITIPLLALATSLTIDGQYRRAFGMLPFIAMFAGIALGAVWEWADRARWWLALPAMLLVFGALGSASYSSLRFYFDDFNNDPNTRFVYAPEVRHAWEYLDTVGHPYVYYWFERGSLNYETRFVLAPNIAGGEDRSHEFTTEGKTAPLRFDLAPEVKPVQPVTRHPDGAVFVFVGAYTPDVNINEVMKEYPGGQVAQLYNSQLKTWEFRAYYLPGDVLETYLRQTGVSFPAPTQPIH